MILTSSYTSTTSGYLYLSVNMGRKMCNWYASIFVLDLHLTNIFRIFAEPNRHIPHISTIGRFGFFLKRRINYLLPPKARI